MHVHRFEPSANEPVHEKTNNLDSDQVRHKPVCAAIEEILDLRRIGAAKTKALISCAVTAQLICGFVFAYANCWFSYAQMLFPDS